MPIVFTRIDNRLIHGQVIESWLPYVKADCIVVANDNAASVAMRQKMMRAAVPSNIDVFIEKVGEVATRLESAELTSKKVLLLFASPEDALRSQQAGLSIAELNLGNIASEESTIALTCTISLNSSDVEKLKLLEKTGMIISSRCVPSDSSRDWKKLIR